MASKASFEERLRQNPYDLCALVGALFDSATRRDTQRAQELRAACEKLNLLSHAGKSLTAIANGGLSVTHRGRAFYTRLPLAGPTEELFACIEDAFQTLSEAVGREPPVLWIDFQDIPPFDNNIRRDIAGFCQLTLSSELLSTESWQPIIWHECGHALLAANCRFLDEGWAVWCQYKSAHPSLFPATREEADEAEIIESITEIPLDGFLRFDAADPAFRDIVESGDEQIAVYLRGYRMVSSLIAAAGCTALAGAFDKIAGGANAIAELTALSPAAIEGERERVNLAGIDRAFRWLRSRDPKAGAIFMPLVREALEKEPGSVEALALLGRMIGSFVLNLPPERPERAALVEELDEIIRRLAAIEPGSAMAEMLRGLHTVSQIVLVPGALTISVANKAEAHLQKAREMNVEDGDLNLALARLEMKKPSSWIVDRANALTYLAGAAGDPRCRWEAVSMASLLSGTPNEVRVSA